MSLSNPTGFSLHVCASYLRAVLAFIAPDTPYTLKGNPDACKQLVDKIKSALGDREGGQRVTIIFGAKEDYLKKHFSDVCMQISLVMKDMHKITETLI